MQKATIGILLLIIISFMIGIYYYPQMPEQMDSHWNASGEANDSMSRFWGIFLMPIILVGMFVLFSIIPLIDPLKNNIKKFRKHFDGFIWFISLFLFYIYILTMLWNLGHNFNMTRFIIPAIGLMFFFAGILIENAKMNWFIGIRTPWTLSSKNVWNKTHKLGGKLFKIAGILAIIGLFFPEEIIIFSIVPVLIFTVYLFVYSYMKYKKEKNSK